MYVIPLYVLAVLITAGLIFERPFSEEDGEHQYRHPLLRFLRKRVAGGFLMFACFVFLSMGEVWQSAGFNTARPIAGGIGIGMFAILFLSAMAVEAKNQRNDYTVRKRFIKYTLQESGFFCLFAAVFIFLIGQNRGRELKDALYFAATMDATWVMCRKLGTTVFYFLGILNAKELRKNSKDMKALRKSVRS